MNHGSENSATQFEWLARRIDAVEVSLGDRIDRSNGRQFLLARLAIVAMGWIIATLFGAILWMLSESSPFYHGYYIERKLDDTIGILSDVTDQLGDHQRCLDILTDGGVC